MSGPHWGCGLGFRLNLTMAGSSMGFYCTCRDLLRWGVANAKLYYPSQATVLRKGDAGVRAGKINVEVAVMMDKSTAVCYSTALYRAVTN